MAYIVSDTIVRYIDEDDVDMRNYIPAGFWKYRFGDKIGSFLEKTKYSTKHGKIYGDADKIAKHVIDAYQRDESHNLGVLFSGGKGLGKSLTTRLIIEKMAKEYPVIIVDSISPDLTDFLTCVHDAVILIDEFEKVFNEGDKENDEGGASVQERMLPVLDGTNTELHNLYLFTVNDVSKVNENFLSRPGRIKYHYRFTSCNEKIIRAYCKDNLEKAELVDEIVDELLATKYVSLDIISSLVNELNNYDISVSDALKYLNVCRSESQLSLRLRYMYRGFEYQDTISLGLRPLGDTICVWEDVSCFENNLVNPADKKAFASNEDSDESEDGGAFVTLKLAVALGKIKIKGSDWVDATKYVRIFKDALSKEEAMNFQLLRAEIRDEDAHFASVAV